MVDCGDSRPRHDPHLFEAPARHTQVISQEPRNEGKIFRFNIQATQFYTIHMSVLSIIRRDLLYS